MPPTIAQLSYLTHQFTQLQLNSPPLVLETQAAQADLESHIGALHFQVSNIRLTIPNPVLSTGLGHGIGRALQQTSHGLSPRISEIDNAAQTATSDCSSDLDLQQLCSRDIVTHWSGNVVRGLFGTFFISSKVSQPVGAVIKTLKTWMTITSSPSPRSVYIPLGGLCNLESILAYN